MHANSGHLIKMANQIGAFFSAQHECDLESAAQAVASHLKLFWAPTMRLQLLAQFDRDGAPQLLAVVQDALRRHRDLLVSSTNPTPALAGDVFPEGGGDAG